MGAAPSLEEVITEQQKMIRRHGRQLGREIARMEREKHELTLKIKQKAKSGDNPELINAMAREYMVYRTNITKLYRLQGQMSNLSQKVQLMRSTTEINRAIINMTNIMRTMNRQLGLENINQMIMEYDMETTKQETVAEHLDDLLDNQIDQEEQEEVVQQVLDEIGVELSLKLKNAPVTRQNDIVEEELEKRFHMLGNKAI
jgi:charged multivesicular body protein 2A